MSTYWVGTTEMVDNSRGPATDAAYVAVTGGGKESVNTQATATGATTLNLANGNVFNLTLTGSVTLTVSGATSGKACSFVLIATQGSGGSKVITWQSGVVWAAGTAPTISTAAGKTDVFSFLSVDGGTTWYGFASGIDLR